MRTTCHGTGVASVEVGRVTGSACTPSSDEISVEEPLEIRVNGAAVTVTMRTPGADFELAQGFLLTEGVIAGRDDVLTIRYCGGAVDRENTYNVLDVTLATGVDKPTLDVTRNFYTTSSCGVCGKASLDAVRLTGRFSPGADPATVAAATLKAMPDQLRSAQKVFDSTGGLHAAALFGVPAIVVIPDVAPPIKIEAVRELGAEVVLVPGSERADATERIATERGMAVIPPFDHRDVIAGQGTVGLEILADAADADVVLVQVGGGGLASGVSTAIKALSPHTAVYGVEPAVAPDARDSLAAKWAQYPAAKRNSCVEGAKLGTSPSYVQVITCLEM